MDPKPTTTTTDNKTRTAAPKRFNDFSAARAAGEKADPLAKPVWVETQPRQGDEMAKGYYILKRLGPVAAADLRLKLQARAELRALLPSGSTVETILRHVSKSGMSRDISLRAGGRDITRLAAQATGDNLASDGWSIKIGGCGMDMGFQLVYNLSRTLYPLGYKCAGKACRSNDHNNDRNNRPRKGKLHAGDGGYAISQRWL